MLVRMKDKSLRFSLDLKQLNFLTVRDKHSLPQVEESLDFLAEAKWYEKAWSRACETCVSSIVYSILMT